MEGQIGALRLIRYGSKGYVEQLQALDDAARSLCAPCAPPRAVPPAALRNARAAPSASQPAGPCLS
jgi:hypothetical protein